MQFTDSHWKHSLHTNNDCADGYWLAPFKNNLSDYPYVVKNHFDIAQMIVELIEVGASAFVIEIPPHELEYQEVNNAFKLVEKTLLEK